MRLAGLRTRQIAIALSFVTSTLVVSRLSNMFQAPLLGAMVDKTILLGSTTGLEQLAIHFRMIILFACLGSVIGALLTPGMCFLFGIAIKRFLNKGSIPGIALQALHPKNFMKIIRAFRLPSRQSFKGISLTGIPKTFLCLNVLVTAIYTIGVLCSLLGGAHLPHLRSTAIQLSGIVNGMATILLTLFVDPSGARITDQAVHGVRPPEDVRSVVFFLLLGRIIGTAILAQLFFWPFTLYIIWVAKLIGGAM